MIELLGEEIRGCGLFITYTRLNMVQLQKVFGRDHGSMDVYREMQPREQHHERGLITNCHVH